MKKNKRFPILIGFLLLATSLISCAPKNNSSSETGSNTESESASNSSTETSSEASSTVPSTISSEVSSEQVSSEPISSEVSSEQISSEPSSSEISSEPSSDSGPWDHLGGEGVGEKQPPADLHAIELLADKEEEIINKISEDQKDIDHSTATLLEYTGKKITIDKPGNYTLTGEIGKQIEITSAGVKLFLAGTTITNIGKKVINSGDDLILVLVDGTENHVINTSTEADESNAISISGKLTINGGGSLIVDSTKSALKADGAFYGLDGDLTLNAGTGHGISADSVILTGGKIKVTSAEKDGIHAETEDDILLEDPIFDDQRGYVYIGDGVSLTVDGVYGDGIQADTFALIKGGEIDITTLPTFKEAESSDGCFKLEGGVYSRVAAENVKNIKDFYQLSQSNKGIKVGEIDYEDKNDEYLITENTAYSLIIAGGQITIDSTDSAIHSNLGDLLISGGDLTIKTSEHGVSADNNVKITGGIIQVVESYEGIEAATIEIAGGFTKINALDDGVNASSEETKAVQKTKCYIKISGGETYVNALGDGIDSNGGIVISGGTLYISGPTSGGDSSLDSETGIIVTGGQLIALGSSGMVETPATNSTQYVVSINLSAATSGKVEVKDGSNIIASFDPAAVFGVNKNYQSIVISLPSFALSHSYSFVTGAKTTSATINGIITKVGQAAGPGGPGGPGPR